MREFDLERFALDRLQSAARFIVKNYGVNTDGGTVISATHADALLILGIAAKQIIYG